MTDEAIDARRRRFLSLSTVTVGGVGAMAAAVPFVDSLAPSERARADGGPLQVDLSAIAPGRMATYAWRGQPIFVVHRNSRQLAALSGHDERLVDPASREDQQPAYACNPTRSLRAAWLVVIGVCTHLGCIPDYVPALAAEPFDAHWPGGFFCPCHKSRYDLAGRVFKHVPAPKNLKVPPYRFLDPQRLEIGVDPVSAGESG